MFLATKKLLCLLNSCLYIIICKWMVIAKGKYTLLLTTWLSSCNVGVHILWCSLQYTFTHTYTGHTKKHTHLHAHNHTHTHIHTHEDNVSSHSNILDVFQREKWTKCLQCHFSTQHNLAFIFIEHTHPLWRFSWAVYRHWKFSNQLSIYVLTCILQTTKSLYLTSGNKFWKDWVLELR